MGYISYQEKTYKALACNHPKVERIWEYGGCASVPTNGSMYRVVCIQLKGSIDICHEFKDNGDGKAIEEAELFLSQQT